MITSAGFAHPTLSPCIDAPPLPAPENKVVKVYSLEELRLALRSQTANTTIMVYPGIYKLQSTIAITADNVTLRGALDTCDSVQLIGPGMNNENHGSVTDGIWVNASNALIANLTVSDIYYHTISVAPNSEKPHIYNTRLVDSGQQFVKINPREFGDGVDNGIVEYSVMEYTNGPSDVDRGGSGTGYTNGIDIHAGSGWRISNNRFRNFHTPDNADHLWNAAVLAWNGASDTVTENNVFIDVDRSIAYGLENSEYDHRRGIIRNNMIVMTPGLYSDYRTKNADASIIVWDSPATKVLHNTVLTNGNIPNSIELRFDTSYVEVLNNIVDAPIAHRDEKQFTRSNNLNAAKTDWFVDPPRGNLKLRDGIDEVIDQVQMHENAALDIDGEQRPPGVKVDLGADEFNMQIEQQ